MKRQIFGVVMVLALVVLAVFGVSAQDTPSTVCLITDIGRINDGTFNQFAFEGMQRAAEEFGLDSTFIETQSPSDYAANIATCLDEEFDILISVGFSLADATIQAAMENPDTFFIGVDQFIPEAMPNIVGLQFREDQAGFLAGTMAALMTETGVVAGVYGLDIPPVVKFRNGFEQGVAYTNPEVETLGVYIPDFQAPADGQDAAAGFIGDNADVIFGAGGPTGSGGISYAAAEGVLVIGVDQDEYFTTFGEGEAPGSENLITSAIKRVDNGVYDMIAAAVNGEPFPANSIYVLEIANDGIGFAPPHDADVPEEVIAQVEAVQAGLGDGSIVTGVDPISGELLGNVAEVATEAGVFNTLLAAVEAAGLVEALVEGGPFTIFAPTDDAFAAALEALGLTAEELLADTELLTSVLTYHVVEGAVLSSTVVTLDGVAVPTLNGAEITISVTEDGVVLNDGVNVTAVDVLTANGVIHVIDAVLLPPSE